MGENEIISYNGDHIDTNFEILTGNFSMTGPSYHPMRLIVAHVYVTPENPSDTHWKL